VADVERMVGSVVKAKPARAIPEMDKTTIEIKVV
jgi:hypothetical protein